MARSGARTRWWLGGLAFSGVVLAHLLAYFAVAPDAHHRAELLEATGHGSWTLAIAVALGSLVAAFGGLALRVARHADYAPSWIGSFVRLSVLQVAGFTGLELVERALIHGAPAEVFVEPAFGIGVVLQVVAAAVAATLMVVFARVIEGLVEPSTIETTHSLAVEFPVLRTFVPRRSVAVGSGTLRGPPIR